MINPVLDIVFCERNPPSIRFVDQLRGEASGRHSAQGGKLPDLELLDDIRSLGGHLGDVPGYAGAAGVYLTLARRFCAQKDGSIDWHRFAALFRAARAKDKPGFDGLAQTVERAFGPDARALVKRLRPP